MPKVISFNICPFVQRVTATLEAKSIPYEVAYISLTNKPQWFLELSPTGQVPILVTESGTALFESDAIIEYIDDYYGAIQEGLNPEEKALDRAWSYQASKNYLVQCGAMRSGDEDTLQERSNKLAKAFKRAETKIGSGPLFKGSALSKVDLAWLPLLHRAAIIEKHTCHDFLANFPNMKKWQASLLKMSFLKKSVSEAFEDAFTGFYLSEKTYLGKGRNCSNDLDAACRTGNCC